MGAIVKFWKHITIVASTIAALGGGVAAYDQIRPFPTRAEVGAIQGQLLEVAGRSCKNELELLESEKRDIQRRIFDAQQSGNAALVQALQEQMQAVMFEIEKARKECGWS